MQDTRRQRQSNEERGVSEVLGVVLMVAITVMLAATAGTFFLGLQENRLGQGAPTAAINHDFDGSGGSHTLEISHESGETLRKSNLRLLVSDAECSGGTLDPNAKFVPAGRFDADGPMEKFTAGTELTLGARTLCGSSSASLDLSGARVTLTWTSPSGGTGDVLFHWTGPSV